MTLHLVNLDACAAQPWHNGGGLTRELLAWPSPAHWQLRISVARIDRDGAFSSFAGLQRWFAVLHGAGVRLDLPRGVMSLTRDDEPLAFDGEAAPLCTLLDGPTDDLNLMARRDAGTARLQRAQPGAGIERPTRWRGLFALEASLLGRGSRSQPLPAGTLAWTDEAAATPWRLQRDSRAYWLTLE